MLKMVLDLVHRIKRGRHSEKQRVITIKPSRRFCSMSAKPVVISSYKEQK